MTPVTNKLNSTTHSLFVDLYKPSVTSVTLWFELLVLMVFAGSGVLHFWMYVTWILSASCLHKAGFSSIWCLVFVAVSSPRPYIWYCMWIMDWSGWWWGVGWGKAVMPWGPREAPPNSSMCVMWGMNWFSSRVWCLQFLYWGSRPTAGSPCLAYCCSLLHSNTFITTYTHTYTCIHSPGAGV